ncbi:MAG TPA: hypothetical protein EYG78_00360 [Sulfurovum sp.]|nr:hypothetical protein [Sulfurovum sp.]
MKKILWMVLLGCASLLHAETKPNMLFDGDVNALLVDKNTFYVKVIDEVTGGCLPKPDQLKQSMEASLKNNGFTVVDKGNYLIPEVQISALGFRINSVCVVDFTVNIYFPIVAEVPNAQNVPSGNRTLVKYNYDVGRHIFNYSKHRMQKTLNKYVKQYGDKIYMSIAKSKDKIYTKFPSIEAEIKKKQQK